MSYIIRDTSTFIKYFNFWPTLFLICGIIQEAYFAIILRMLDNKQRLIIEKENEFSVGPEQDV